MLASACPKAEPMEWKYKRRFIFTTSDKWSGWFCERCCWSRALPALVAERSEMASRVKAEFEAHDCEQFARENWPVADSIFPTLTCAALRLDPQPAEHPTLDVSPSR
jgi:hypothetical protein